ncbi:hypothetical protein AB0L06_21760 [Spirillospora sp. NPDC052269]
MKVISTGRPADWKLTFHAHDWYSTHVDHLHVCEVGIKASNWKYVYGPWKKLYRAFFSKII